MKQGFFITFEGGEGSGKSTQIELLRSHLVKMGEEVVVTREPGGTTIGEQIRDVVLSNKNMSISFTTEVLLFQASRAQNFSEVVLPALKAGKVVLSDRSRDSSVVYQGILREFGVAEIERLNDISTQNTQPNVTFLFDVPAEIGLARRSKTGELNRLDQEKKQFHERVREAYSSLAKADTTGRWVVIDATREENEIDGMVWEEVQKRFMNQ